MDVDQKFSLPGRTGDGWEVAGHDSFSGIGESEVVPLRRRRRRKSGTEGVPKETVHIRGERASRFLSSPRRPEYLPSTSRKCSGMELK